MFSSIKWIFMGLATIAIVATIGGFWYNQRAALSDLQDIIAEKDAEIQVLKEQVSGLIIDNSNLLLSNESLQNTIDSKDQAAEAIRKELDTLRVRERESNRRLNEFVEIIRNIENQNRAAEARNSNRNSLYIQLLNRDLQCMVDNFNRRDGVCENGEFIVDE